MTDLFRRKIFIVGAAGYYANWMEGVVVGKMEDADLVVFTGGEDVDPSLYGQPEHPTTYSNLDRDLYEKGEFVKAQELNKPCLGICRGSQFLCVMAGGHLVQNQPNPSHVHKIKTFTGDELLITSTHHQAAYPYNLDPSEYKILGWTDGMLAYHKNGADKELNPEKECEIVYYPNIRALGIQGHPEMMSMDSPTVEYLRKLLSTFLNGTL